MENAARWWVNMNRQLPKRKRTWSNLKKGLLRRYGEKKDKSAAEWRVSMRPMMPGETYADFAAGLRDVVGRNHVSERVLLAQFYRCLDKTTRKLVRQAPKPKTLEEAVDKATEIDDPMDNVAQGMLNVGLPWATAPRPYLIPMTGTMGQTMVIPGIGGPGLPTDMTSTTGVQGDTNEVRHGMEHAALFTNPQGVYNAVTGTWDPPPGHQWNGKYWYEPKKTERKRAAAASPASGRTVTKKTARTKPKRETVESSSDESDAKPKKKKLKAAASRRPATSGGLRNRHRKRSGRARRADRTAACASSVDSLATGRRSVRTSRSALHATNRGTSHARVLIRTPRPEMTSTCSNVDGRCTQRRKTSRGRDNGGMASRTRRKSPAGGVDDEGRRRNDAAGGDVGSGRSAGGRSRSGNCPAGERKRLW
ncbi:hypothetical protein PF006_g29993 [Phytophthora fragariae]|uniref:Retrotransposon gag domain-containing protein n=1 Tax=Phytophthora fragariae TaxID=53985 RepID=A0A6A3Q2J8_9STRA|nr:hypothetical protein PF006_g29993 [Phytophthora fragariae]